MHSFCGQPLTNGVSRAMLGKISRGFSNFLHVYFTKFTTVSTADILRSVVKETGNYGQTLIQQWLICLEATLPKRHRYYILSCNITFVVAGNEFRSLVPNLSPYSKQRMIQTRHSKMSRRRLAMSTHRGTSHSTAENYLFLNALTEEKLFRGKNKHQKKVGNSHTLTTWNKVKLIKQRRKCEDNFQLGRLA